MITGKFVGLRAVEEGDLPDLLSWRNNPNLRRFFREYRELNSAQQMEWFKSKVNNDHATKMFSIVDQGDQKLLGACGLCYIDWVNRSADFSIYIGYEEIYIDEKYALDAAKTLIKYAFGELSLHRVWSEIYAFDIKKQDFFSQLGFVLEGKHRETHWAEGGWHDSLFYGLLNHEAGFESA